MVGPIKASGSHKAISGKMQSKMMATTMHSMKGKAPNRIVCNFTSGAMPLMT